MVFLKIGDTDFTNYIAEQKTTYTVLASEDSGRNARGNMIIDVVNKKTRVDCVTHFLTQGQMSALLAAIDPYVISVTYWDSKTGGTKTMSCYVSAPQPDIWSVGEAAVIYKPMSVGFIEM